jgi:hypothetical protein
MLIADEQVSGNFYNRFGQFNRLNYQSIVNKLIQLCSPDKTSFHRFSAIYL